MIWNNLLDLNIHFSEKVSLLSSCYESIDLHLSMGGGILPLVHGDWSSSKLIVIFECQWDKSSTILSSAF